MTKNTLPRKQERALEDWLVQNKDQILSTTDAEAATSASAALDFKVTPANISGARGVMGIPKYNRATKFDDDPAVSAEITGRLDRHGAFLSDISALSIALDERTKRIEENVAKLIAVWTENESTKPPTEA